MLAELCEQVPDEEVKVGRRHIDTDLSRGWRSGRISPESKTWAVGSFIDAFLSHLGHEDYDFVAWMFVEMGWRHHGSDLFDELRSTLARHDEKVPAEVVAAIDEMEAQVEVSAVSQELPVRLWGMEI